MQGKSECLVYIVAFCEKSTRLILFHYTKALCCIISLKGKIYSFMQFVKYVKLMQPKHYLKNLLIFCPLFFGGSMFEWSHLSKTIIAFVVFSLLASAVYILNDLRDIKDDKMHPTKKNRPIASGEVSHDNAVALFFVLIAAAICVQLSMGFSLISFSLLGAYLLINIFYSFGLKHIPIIDIIILAIGFLIRLFYGGDCAGIVVSTSLCLVVLFFSFYLVLGKRRNEIKGNGSTTRKVNQYYTERFLNNSMYVCLCVSIVFYFFWAFEKAQQMRYMFLTIPFIIIISITYNLVLNRKGSDGDPVDVFVGDKILIAEVMIYGILMMGLIYS